MNNTIYFALLSLTLVDVEVTSATDLNYTYSKLFVYESYSYLVGDTLRDFESLCSLILLNNSMDLSEEIGAYTDSIHKLPQLDKEMALNVVVDFIDTFICTHQEKVLDDESIERLT